MHSAIEDLISNALDDDSIAKLCGQTPAPKVHLSAYFPLPLPALLELIIPPHLYAHYKKSLQLRHLGPSFLVRFRKR